MDLASLGIRVDSQGVRESAAQLDGLTTAANKAEGAAERVAPAVRGIGTAAKQTGASVNASLVRPIEQAAKATGAATLSTKQYAQALRLVPAQLTDIATGLASGQSPFIVAIQQGGQLRDSFGGIGAAVRGLASVLTPTRLLLGATAGAAVLLGKAFAEGQAETFGFVKAIALSGNAAGTTSGQLRQMAQNIDRVIGTEANAAAVLAQLSATGKVTNDQLQNVATATIRLNKIAGVAIEDAVKQFASLADKPTEAAAQLNRQYNFLSVAQIKQIRELEELGRRTDAAALAQNLLADTLNRRTQAIEGDLGTLQRAAKATGGFFKEMWDAALDIGRETTTQERLAELEQLIAGAQRGIANGGLLDGVNGANSRRRENLSAFEAERTDLQAQVNLARDQAVAEAEIAKIVQAAADEEVAALRNADQRKRQLASQSDQLSKAQLSASLSGLQIGLRAELGEYERQGEELEALRDAKLLSEADYYAQRLALIKNSTDAQVRALEEENRRLAQESRRVAGEATAAKAAADGITGERRAGALEEANRRATEAQLAQIQNAEKMKANDAEIIELNEKKIAQQKVLSIQYDAQAAAADRAFANSRRAAEQDLAVLQKQYDRALAAQTLGQRQQQVNAGRNAIDDRFGSQRQDLERDRRNGDVTEQQYQRQLELINEFHAKALTAFEAYWDKLTEGERSWITGAKSALQQYLDEAANVAAATQSALTNAFNGAEDALVQLVTTGKLNFKQLANSIIADLIRIQVRAQLASIFSSLFGGVAPAGIPMAGDPAMPVAGGARVASVGTSPGAGVSAASFSGMNSITESRGASMPVQNSQPPSAPTFNITMNNAPGVDAAMVSASLQQLKEELRNTIPTDAYRNKYGWNRAA